MLSETDIHHITALLYVAAGDVASVTTLGEKVFDTASGTKRDVDIVVATSGSVAVIAAEVKHTSRPLDVALIEGLCLKFLDMPSITDRNVVSSSGFTAPAIAKARTHGVNCFTLRRGPLRRLGSIDISHAGGMGYTAPIWESGPHIRLFTEPDFPPERKARIRPSLSVRYPKNSFPTVPLAVFQDRLVSLSLKHVSFPDDSSPVLVAVRLQITDNPFFTSGRVRYRITLCEVSGQAAMIHGFAPFSDTWTMEGEDGKPFANAAIAEVGALLIAFATAPGSNSLNVMVLPPGVRAVRPTRARIANPMPN